ncbi:hypothetical protein [Spirochaeta cellobiosiphila]|uniref:hypothetical protein n=1 Tax=Spirochaeta cellobiosiphila TaxID=504483 RepID=UPI00040269CC|nr:hypothetical protein [Spirochaeta cellobiosiphila]
MTFKEKVEEILAAVKGFSGRDVIYLRDMTKGCSVYKFYINGNEKRILISESRLETDNIDDIINWIRANFSELSQISQIKY